MRKTTGLLGAVAISSGLIATGVPAYADSSGDNGLNLLNGDNVSVLPTQLCLNGLSGILSNVIDVGSDSTALSPQTNNCVNAPVIDHPTVTSTSQAPPVATSPAPQQLTPLPTERTMPLPLAPAPVSTVGHHAVTG